MKEKYLMLDDLTFKNLFVQKEILKDFLESFYEYLGKKRTIDIQNKISAQDFIVPDNSKEKCFFRDVVASLDNGEQINLEAFTKSLTEREYKRVINYLFKLYISQIKRGEKDFERCRKVTGIVIVPNGKNKPFMEVYRYENINNHTEPFDEVIEIYVINIDNIEEGNERFIRWIKMMGEEEMKEVKKIAKGDDKLMEAVQYLDKYMNANPKFKEYMEGRMADVKYEGIEEGENKKSIEVARLMLNAGESPEKIMKYTKLTMEEIEKL